jgi:glutamine cyclotransferase
MPSLPFFRMLLRPPFRAVAAALLGAALCLLPAAGAAGAPGGRETPVHGVRVVRALPHDPGAYTQGLFWHEGLLVESTGRYGESRLRAVEPETGRVALEVRLPGHQFGEGAAPLGGAVLQLTWKSGQGYIRDLKTFRELGTFRYEGEGWGLAATPEGPVMSDGSSRLAFLSPRTLKPERTITVRDGEREVERLNELEWIDGALWCNIWFEDRIAVVDPASGEVRAYIDLSGLRARLPRGAEAANGIAHDPETGRVFVTGKLWNTVFEVRVEPPIE